MSKVKDKLRQGICSHKDEVILTSLGRKRLFFKNQKVYPVLAFVEMETEFEFLIEAACFMVEVHFTYNTG